MSRDLKKTEEELLEEFEKMLSDDDFGELELDDDFGHYFPPHFVNHKPDKNAKKIELDSPPPIPKKAMCKHKERKKVEISKNLRFYVCKDCGEDLGDIK